jgi:hypothetical protein
VQTNRTIPNNRPDIVIYDDKNGTYMVIDAAISGDRIVIKKETGNALNNNTI